VGLTFYAGVSAFERSSVEQLTASTHTRRIGNRVARQALPRGVPTVATACARLMADQHPARAEAVPVRAECRWQDHPATLGAGYETPEAGHRQDGAFGSCMTVRLIFWSNITMVPAGGVMLVTFHEKAD
jgi:hypothetical protein